MNKITTLATFALYYEDVPAAYKKTKDGLVKVKPNALSAIKRANLERLAKKSSHVAVWLQRFTEGLYWCFKKLATANVLILAGIDMFFRWLLNKK